MKRVLALIAVVALVTVMFVGCGDGGKENTSSLDLGGGDGSIVNFAESGFSIVRAQGNEVVGSLAKKIFQAVKQNTGKTLRNTDDSSEVNTVGEILIGDTNRAESAKIFDFIIAEGTGHESEYAIAFMNGKIVINAFTDAGLEAAVDKFVADYCTECKLANNIKYIFRNENAEGVITLNGASINVYKFVVPDYNHSYCTQMKIDELCELVKSKTGACPAVIEDTVAKRNDYEIVIGNANREGVKAVSDLDTYEINNSGRTVYINGGRNYSISYALDLLINEIKNDGKVTAANTTGKYQNTMDYKLVWTDEFDTLNKDTWTIVDQVQNVYGKWYGMGTARSGKEENLGVKDGKMYHSATFDDENFYGTYITTGSSVRFTYGYMEISTKIADGDGIWHCFWTWADGDDHLEFDILECWSGAHYYVNVLHEFVGGENIVMEGGDPHSYVKLNDHYDHETFWNDHWQNKQPNLHDDFHAVGCEWTETDVKYVRDGEVTMVHTYAGTQHEFLYSQPHYFILSSLVGSNYNDDPDDGKSTTGVKKPDLNGEYWHNGRNTWTIEYLQLFQKDGAYLDLK